MYPIAKTLGIIVWDDKILLEEQWGNHSKGIPHKLRCKQRVIDCSSIKYIDPQNFRRFTDKFRWPSIR